jgi:hypothetical protein
MLCKLDAKKSAELLKEIDLFLLKRNKSNRKLARDVADWVDQVCICICMYVCMYVHVCMHIYIYIHIHIYIYSCTYTYICIYKWDVADWVDQVCICYPNHNRCVYVYI